MPAHVTDIIYFQYAGISLLIVGGCVAISSWLFVMKSADEASRTWFAAIALQLMAGMVLFSFDSSWKQAAYLAAAVMTFSSLYLFLHSLLTSLGTKWSGRHSAGLWLIHLGLFAGLYGLNENPQFAYFFSVFGSMLLECVIIFAARMVRQRNGAPLVSFAEIGFFAAFLSNLVRVTYSQAGVDIALYTNLSIQSVLAMSFQCVSIVLSCFYYISISVDRVEMRELSVRLEADRLRIQEALAQKHAEATQLLIAERDRMMIINSQFSTLTSLSLLGGGIVHEIVQPLQAARSALDILAIKQSTNPAALRPYIDTVSRLVDQISDIIEGLRRIIREKAVDLRDVECASLIQRVFPIFKSEAGRRAIESRCEIYRDTIGKKVKVNPVLLERILFNLAANALEAFDPPGQPGSEKRELQLGLELDSQRGMSCLKISVHDTGMGAAAGDYSQWFDIFGTTKKDGTGLGLYMVKTFVESWQGAISAGPSQIGPTGTTVEIWLPMSASADSEALDS